jgi:acyl-CoA thioesterase
MAMDDNDRSMGTSFFSRGTAVEPLGDTRFAAHLDEAWNCPIVPQGGIVAATAARAMTAALGDPAQSLRSIHSVFVGPVQAGPVEIDVTVLRRGRTISQLSATVRNPGAAAGLTALAVFGSVREGFDFVDIAPPDGVQPPDECPSYRDPPPEEFAEFFDGPPMNFWNNIEGRPTIGHPPWEDYEPTSSLRASWFRFDDPPRADDGTWDPLALVTLSDTMPSAVGERLGAAGEKRRWRPPSTDLTVHVLEPARSEWVLTVNRARHAGEGYASADVEIWDVDSRAEPRLVTYGTQVMFFTFPEG